MADYRRHYDEGRAGPTPTRTVRVSGTAMSVIGLIGQMTKCAHGLATTRRVSVAATTSAGSTATARIARRAGKARASSARATTAIITPAPQRVRIAPTTAP